MIFSQWNYILFGKRIYIYTHVCVSVYVCVCVYIYIPNRKYNPWKQNILSLEILQISQGNLILELTQNKKYIISNLYSTTY